MEKAWGKNGGTKNVTIGCSSSTFTALSDTLFKTLKGEMVTTLNQQHIPIYAKQAKGSIVERCAEGIGLKGQ